MNAPAVVMASRAEHVQRVVTPGGLTAWLVESYAVPLVAGESGAAGFAGLCALMRDGERAQAR